MPTIAIRNRFGGVLKEIEADSLRLALEQATRQGADLQDADLQRAHLQRADLREAYLQRADLREAYLREAYLQGADLRGAYLQGADLQRADLRDADLRDADLHGAHLQDADLQRADLRGADLQRADLRDAYLQDAYLQDAKINWSSHALIAELLYRAAGDNVDYRTVAGLVAISTDWCWDKFTAIPKPRLLNWALSVLACYVQPDDDAPDCITPAE